MVRAARNRRCLGRVGKDDQVEARHGARRRADARHRVLAELTCVPAPPAVDATSVEEGTGVVGPGAHRCRRQRHVTEGDEGKVPHVRRQVPP